MGYIKVDWPDSQEWMDFIEEDEATGETIGDIEYGPDSSVFVPEEIYNMGVDAYAEMLENSEEEQFGTVLAIRKGVNANDKRNEKQEQQNKGQDGLT